MELDYQALHPSMLYAQNGIQLNEDPYSLDGNSSEIRNFLKVVMLVRINTGNEEKTRKIIQSMINAGELKNLLRLLTLKL